MRPLAVEHSPRAGSRTISATASPGASPLIRQGPGRLDGDEQEGVGVLEDEVGGGQVVGAQQGEGRLCGIAAGGVEIDFSVAIALIGINLTGIDIGPAGIGAGEDEALVVRSAGVGVDCAEVDAVAALLEARNDIAAGTDLGDRGVDEPVLAETALHPVIAEAAPDPVVASATVDHIVARSAPEIVGVVLGSAAADQIVVTVAAVDEIDPGAAVAESFVFGSVLRLNIRRYAAFAFIGVLVWNWFQASLVEAAGAITGNRQLIRRPGFPETVLPIIPVLTNLIRFLLAVPVLLLVIGPSGTPVGMTILTLPVLMLLQFILTLSLAYHVATVNVVFRDTQHLLGVLLQLLFFLTPIFYDVSTIPAPYQGLYHWNPLTHLVNAYRAVLLHGALPEWPALLVVGAVALGLLSLGYWLFLHMTSRFVEEL